MTIAYFSGLLITGTNSDRTGGTWTNLPAGWKFLETDTGLTYYWTGTAWFALFDNLHVTPDKMKTGYYFGLTTPVATGCTGIMTGLATNIAVGSGGTSGVVRTSGSRFRYTTGATINSLCGARFNSSVITERSLNPNLFIKLGLSTATTTLRCFFGFTSSTSAPASTADPLANLSGVGFWYDSGVDTEWMIIQNDGSASSDITTIVNIATANTSAHTLQLKAVDASAKFQYSYDGAALADINTKIPAQTTGLGWMYYAECLAGSAARNLDVYYMWIKQDP